VVTDSFSQEPKMPAPAVIEVSVRNVYGRPTIYPANGAAERLANISGTKTLSAKNLVDAAELGLVVEYVGDYARWLRDAMQFAQQQEVAA
jgi:hypothetical protein